MRRDVDLPWLFSYGSLMNPQQFNKIAGKWQYARKALLYGYQLVFSGEGSADIILADPKSCVYGVAYEISAQQLGKLDRYEGVPDGFYFRKKVQVEMTSRKHSAYAYLKSQKSGFRRPPSRYMKLLISGLRFHGYGEGVVRDVRNHRLNIT